MSNAAVNVNSGVMLWRRIADEIEKTITRGTLASGARLPGEVEIAARFGVNRHTVRRALAELAARGLVRAERGSGTYVEPQRLAYPIQSRTRFSEIVHGAGREAGGRLVRGAIEQASPEIAERLAIAPETSVARLDILRSVDGVPLSFGSTWLPIERVPDAIRSYRKTRSITRTLSDAGIRDYRRATTRVFATLADGDYAEELRLAPGQPLLHVEAVDVTLDTRPILTTKARFVADRVELVFEPKGR